MNFFVALALGAWGAVVLMGFVSGVRLRWQSYVWPCITLALILIPGAYRWVHLYRTCRRFSTRLGSAYCATRMLFW